MMIAPHAKYPAYCISSLHLAHLQVLHRIMGTCIMNTTEREVILVRVLPDVAYASERV